MNTNSALLRFRDTVYSCREQRSENLHISICNLFLTRCDVEQGLQRAESLLNACKEHFESYGSTRHCYSDLTPFIAFLEDKLSHDFLDHLGSEGLANSNAQNNIVRFRKINTALSLEYRFRSNRGADTKRVGDFIGRCLTICRSGILLQEIDDYDRSLSVILTAMGLLQLCSPSMSTSQEHVNTVTRLLQIVLILFHLISRHPDFYGAVLIAIRATSLLGQGSFALKLYKTLSIKNLQIESFAHTTLTRVSTLQPRGIPQDGVSGDPDGEPYQPLDQLQRASQQYDKMERIFTRDIVLGLQEGSYRNVEDAINTKKAYQNSICKYIYLLEKNRLMRLLGVEGGFTTPSGQINIGKSHLISFRSLFLTRVWQTIFTTIAISVACTILSLKAFLPLKNA